MLPKLIQAFVIRESCIIQAFFELFSVDFEVFAELVKAWIIVSELHVRPAQKHDGIFGM